MSSSKRVKPSLTMSPMKEAALQHCKNSMADDNEEIIGQVGYTPQDLEFNWPPSEVHVTQKNGEDYILSIWKRDGGFYLEKYDGSTKQKETIDIGNWSAWVMSAIEDYHDKALAMAMYTFFWGMEEFRAYAADYISVEVDMMTVTNVKGEKTTSSLTTPAANLFFRGKPVYVMRENDMVARVTSAETMLLG